MHIDQTISAAIESAASLEWMPASNGQAYIRAGAYGVFGSVVRYDHHNEPVHSYAVVHASDGTHVDGDPSACTFATPERAITAAEQLQAVLSSLADSVRDAISRWTNCDWTHETGRDDNGAPVYCSGHHPESCDYCAWVSKSVEAAHAAGWQAVAKLQAGDVAAALELVEEAASEEAEWGHAPTWRPVVDEIDGSGLV